MWGREERDKGEGREGEAGIGEGEVKVMFWKLMEEIRGYKEEIKRGRGKRRWT